MKGTVYLCLGVALLSHPFDATKAEEMKKKKEEAANESAADNQTTATAAFPGGKTVGGVRKPFGGHFGRRGDAPAGARPSRSCF